jgi:hypothetical protein
MEDIRSYLNKNFNSSEVSTIDSIKHVIPFGWHFFIDQIMRYGDLVNCSITDISVDKGLLRIHGSCSLDSDQQLFNRLSQSIARDSATTCMICSRRGFRRKKEVGWPSLCGTHYIEYVNFLDNSE